MLPITTIYCDDKPLTLYLVDAPKSKKFLALEDSINIKMRELCEFFGVDVPALDPCSMDSRQNMAKFVITYFTGISKEQVFAATEQGDLFMPWRNFYTIADMMPESLANKYTDIAIKLEGIVDSYAHSLRAVKYKEEETDILSAPLTIATAWKHAAVETLNKSLESPTPAGITACRYQHEPQAFLTEKQVAQALSKYLGRKFTQAELRNALIKIGMLETMKRCSERRYTRTSIGLFYSTSTGEGRETRREWHKSIITLLISKAGL